MNRLILSLLPLIDLIAVPFVYAAALVLKAIRRAGVQRMPLSKLALLHVGVFPVRDHYYEPLFDGRSLERPLNQVRDLPGIDWNGAGQLALLGDLRYGGELEGTPFAKPDGLSFHFNNGAFESGDAEYFYSLIRLKKPTRILEIGSGQSTLLAMQALQRNREEDPGYRCNHLCVEPYEMPWLESTGVTVVRQRVERVGKALFAELDRDDILFIDSSHIIRPQGDVLFEYLELLPALRAGVIVHVHDIFSPRDYPSEWIIDEVKFWNEQYLLEAFLTSNSKWRILGALNYLCHEHFDLLQAACPFLTHDSEPGSFYIQKIA